MISVVIVGSGRVASQLIAAFSSIDSIQLKQVYSRNLNNLLHLKSQVEITDDLTQLVKADITIIAVSDDVISQVSSEIKNSFVVHTSGTKSIDELKNVNDKGVFYPLQSFSKEKRVDFSEVPFCIEAPNKSSYQLLKTLVNSLNAEVYNVDSEQRKHLHLAAVFANNFSNHMVTLAKDICTKSKVPFEVLLPLIKETTNKLLSLSPEEAQTGPATRNDQKTINNQLDLLSGTQKEIYQLITQSIQNHGKKL